MNYETLLEKGDELFDSGDQIPAIQTYAQAAMQEPGRKEALVRLGLAYKEMGDPAGAIDFLQKAAIMDQEDAFIRFMIGITLYELGAYDEATDYLRNAVAKVESLYAEAVKADAQELIESTTAILNDARALLVEMEPHLAPCDDPA